MWKRMCSNNNNEQELEKNQINLNEWFPVSSVVCFHKTKKQLKYWIYSWIGLEICCCCCCCYLYCFCSSAIFPERIIYIWIHFECVFVSALKRKGQRRRVVQVLCFHSPRIICECEYKTDLLGKRMFQIAKWPEKWASRRFCLDERIARRKSMGCKKSKSHTKYSRKHTHAHTNALNNS